MFGVKLKRFFLGNFHFYLYLCNRNINNKKGNDIPDYPVFMNYVDEAVFRYNSREQSESDRFRMMFKRSIGIFRYADVKNVG